MTRSNSLAMLARPSMTLGRQFLFGRVAKSSRPLPTTSPSQDTIPLQPTTFVSGRAGHLEASSTFRSSTMEITKARLPTSSEQIPSVLSCTPTTILSAARKFVSSSSISGLPHPYMTSFAASRSQRGAGPSSRTRSPSSSTTPIRRWPLSSFSASSLT